MVGFQMAYDFWTIFSATHLFFPNHLTYMILILDYFAPYSDGKGLLLGNHFGTEIKKHQHISPITMHQNNALYSLASPSHISPNPTQPKQASK